MKALAETERARLAHLEARIERGIKSFLDVGQALLEIRDDSLFRGDFSSFGDYLVARWGISRQHGYRLLEASKVVEGLSPLGDTQPTSEAQVRPLVGLPPEQQGKVWKEAVATAPKDRRTGKPRVTMAHVARTMAGEPPPVSRVPMGTPSNMAACAPGGVRVTPSP